MQEKQGNVKIFYDALSRWGKPHDIANIQRIEQTISMIPEDVNTILDVGCGDGTVSNQLMGKGLDVTGVDLSGEALRYFTGRGVIARLDQLSFPDSSFDLIICAEVLEHLPDDIYESALKEIERVAQKYILITTPNKEYLPAGFVKCESCSAIYHKNLHFRSFDRKKHGRLFKEFELLKTVGINSWKHRPLITYLEQHLCGVYKYKDGLICPYCGSIRVEKPSLGLLRKGILKSFRVSCKLFPKYPKARWIASLYRCRESKHKKGKRYEHWDGLTRKISS